MIMPNHVHGIVIINDRADEASANHVRGINIAHDRAVVSPPHVGATQWVAPTGRQARPRGPARGSIGAIMGAYKMAVTREIVQQFGGVPRIWQRNYYEHVVRGEADRARISAYIECNVADWAEDDENPMR